MSKDLSILICSLHKRFQYLDRNKKCLSPQINDRVEVLFNIDDGQKTIGEKRNELLLSATGEYIVFVDDDDMVSEKYIQLILKCIDKRPDVIGIHLLMYYDMVLKGLTYHSIKYTEWSDRPCNVDNKLTYYFRNPNHLNPVKRSIALGVKFPHVNMCEDADYSKNLLKKFIMKDTLHEEYIQEPIYYYLVRTHKEV